MDAHLLYAAINFFLFVGILTLLLRKPLKEFWADRSEQLRVRIAEARDRRAKAETEFEKLSARVARMESEMEALKERMRADGELEQRKLIEEAKAQAARLGDATRRVSEQEVAKAEVRLRDLATRMTVDLAERKIQSEMTDEDQDRLAVAFLDRLADSNLHLVPGGRS